MNLFIDLFLKFQFYYVLHVIYYFHKIIVQNYKEIRVTCFSRFVSFNIF